MPPSNLERMIQLADEFFAAKSDPEQISVDENTISQLRAIHLSTMTERRNEQGPIAWFIVIPTTHEIMKLFVDKKISEPEILDRTPLAVKYDAIYLCSALVLPEHRGKGLAKQIITEAISSIIQDHPIANFFYWGWSIAGERLATSIARKFNLPLFRRPE